MNKKAIITIVILLVLVFAGGIWYYEASMSSAATSTPPVTTAQTSTTTTTTSASSTVSYTNNEYGFTVALPADWAGYSIVTSTWTGNGDEGCPAAGCPAVHGPIISIRSPLYTSSTPTQDIPIMVFTLSEWSSVSTGTLAVSAAPIPPSELGQNAQYVFALPARYNYAYPQGWQEVETIIQGNPLHAF
jgi:hypothetical protein